MAEIITEPFESPTQLASDFEPTEALKSVIIRFIEPAGDAQRSTGL